MTEPTEPAGPPAGSTDRSTLPGREPSPLPPLVLVAPPSPGLAAGLRAGLAMGRERLLRRRVGLLALLGLALAVVGALVERRAGSAGAVDRALAGAFRLVLPLVSFGVVGEASARSRLRDAAWPVARFGLAGRDVALGLTAAAGAAAALLGASLAAVAVLVAHAPGAAPLVPDLALSGWIGALAGAAYASWFALGSTFFARGAGRWGVLVADLALGGSSGLAAALLPCANARNLLGGAPPFGLSQPASSALLAAMAVGLAVLAALRSRDAAR